MEISAKMVKELRDKTNAGMMDCKKALNECDCDMEKAIDWLRQKGLMSARKREGRATKEGLVVTGITADLKKGAMVELNCETDFVAKNEAFKKLGEDIVAKFLKASQVADTLDEVLTCTCGDFVIKDEIGALIGTIGENINLRRFVVCQASDNSILHTYVHGAGRIGVMLELAVEKCGQAADDLAHDLAMHIAAANPAALTAEDVPQDMLTREKALYLAKAKESGKPENIWDKIVEGNVRKFYGEVVLLEQPFVKDPSKSVAAVLKEAKECGQVSIKSFVRFQLGEELEGQEQSGE